PPPCKGGGLRGWSLCFETKSLSEKVKVIKFGILDMIVFICKIKKLIVHYKKFGQHFNNFAGNILVLFYLLKFIY
ncbi:MAG: hypothetical protein WBQ38_14490, partial [Ignavibacteria bacterium]